ncbi:hypothetical protein LCGC14_0576450 [marine sediment metagenome]|uniref:Zinc-ribbon domain-containing protein n=1 Tax=marine sediment metagenome TaxID=412755 RepID=A0A0F9U3W1_9ZZZZ
MMDWGSNMWVFMGLAMGIGVLCLIIFVLYYLFFRGKRSGNVNVKTQIKGDQEFVKNSVGEEIKNEESYFCQNCGEKLDEKSLKYCPSCGSELNIN